MIHKMKLNDSPFERIKNGTKTIEKIKKMRELLKKQ